MIFKLCNELIPILQKHVSFRPFWRQARRPVIFGWPWVEERPIDCSVLCAVVDDFSRVGCRHVIRDGGVRANRVGRVCMDLVLQKR